MGVAAQRGGESDLRLAKQLRSRFSRLPNDVALCIEQPQDRLAGRVHSPFAAIVAGLIQEHEILALDSFHAGRLGVDGHQMGTNGAAEQTCDRG